MSTPDEARERRWTVISTTGRWAFLGRGYNPEPEEFEAAAKHLARLGHIGWLTVTAGLGFIERPNVLLVRPLAGAGDWNAALAAFMVRAAEEAASGPATASTHPL